MLVYILKSIACLAILFVFYKVFLEKENMHVFKRFYLLGALVVSLLIPALVFTEYVEVAPATSNIVFVTPDETGYSKDAIQVPQALDKDITDIAPLLWSVYFIGLFFFGLKFIRNLFQIFRRIRRNPKHKLSRFTQVLLRETVPPHTFFSYIFLNKMKLESNEIPKEVLLHEETHAKQKHSYDVVLVEFLQVIFWVNPLVYFFKKAIKLNHEFLADQAVLKKDIDKATYQNTLLSYLSPDSKKKYQPLANAINYSSTRLTVFGKTFTFGNAVGQVKKRFTIMKTHTSKKAVLLRTLLLIPLLAILLFGFSETKVETISNQISTVNEINSTQLIQFAVISKDKIVLNGKNYSIKTITPEINLLIDDHIPLSKVRLFGTTDLKIENPLFKELTKTLSILGVGEILFCKTGCTPENSNSCEQCSIKSASKSQILSYNLLAAKYNKEPIEKRKIPSNDIKELEKVYGNMTQNQKENAEPFPECLPKNIQDGASSAQIAEYNALAKKYNTMLSKSKSIQIKMKDVERLEYIYGLMSEKQKAAAEPFPDFPEPPPPPKAPKVPDMTEKFEIEEEAKMRKQEILMEKEALKLEQNEVLLEQHEAKMRKQEVLLKEKESKLEEQEILLEEQEARLEEIIANQEIIAEENVRIYQYGMNFSSIDANPDLKSTLKDLANREAQFYFNGNKVSAEKGMQIARNKKNITIETLPYTNKKPEVKIYTDKTNLSIPPPPNPPTPKSPLDHVIEMAKKNAKFYFEGKLISSDKAIELIKNNDEINIDSRTSNGKQPVVRLSREPITIGN